MAKVILALHQFFPRFYTGTETLVLEVAKELQTRNHDVAVLCVEPFTPDIDYPDKPELRRDCYEGVTVWRLFTGAEPSLNERLERESYDDKTMSLLNDFILQEQPDIVHAFHFMRLTLSFGELVKKQGIPFYFTSTDFWFLCPTYQLLQHDGTLCSKPDRYSCFKCLVALYMRGVTAKPLKLRLAIAFPRLAGLISPMARTCQNILGNRIERNHRLMDLIDGVFWSNEFLENLFIANGYKPQNQKTIGFPVPQKANCLFSLPLAEASSELRVAFIGTLRPSKGPQVLINAVTKLAPQTPVRLSIWGAAEAPEFEQELKLLANDDSRIIFQGTFPQDKFADVLKDIDVLVIPSLWYENTPLTALSALAARRALVVSDLGGLSSLVDKGRNGYIFPPGDVNALSCLLERIAKDKTELLNFADHIQPPGTVAEYVDNLLLCYEKFSQGVIR